VPAVPPPDEELATLRRENAELRDKLLRLTAELQNQLKRAQRAQQESQRFAEAELARDLLVVLDDVERAQDAARNIPDAQPVAEGVRIMAEHFQKVLRDHQIVPIDAVGRPFDPVFHEALMQQASNEQPAGVVLQELARGYRMHERVLRHSRVIVSSGPPTGELQSTASEEP
jgi:molecular chaperone GrpE